MTSSTKSKLLSCIYIYLTCYFMDLFGFPDLLMLVLGSIFCLILLIDQKKIRVDLGLLLLSAAMFSYCIIVFGIRAIVVMMPYIPILMYVLSNYLAKAVKKEEKSEQRLLDIIYCLVLGHGVYGILNSCTYLAGYRWEGTRGWMDIWSKEYIAGTQLTFYFITVFAMVLPAILCFKRKKVISVGVIAVSLFLVYASLATRTRTTLLVLILVFGIQIVLFGVLEKEKLKKLVTPKLIAVVFGSAMLGFLILLLALRDNAMIQAFVENLGKDGGILNNIRFKVQRQAISQMFDYPFGGYQMILDLKLTHNTWLDILNAAGVIPFFAFVAYTVFTIYELICFVRMSSINTETKIIFTGLYGAFFLYYSVEPALLISVHCITPWILLNGLVHGYVSKTD